MTDPKTSETSEGTFTFTVRSYRFPEADSELERAVLEIWRTSNFPFTDKALIKRETLNRLLQFILYECKDAREKHDPEITARILGESK
jgi:hypothetical protein